MGGGSEELDKASLAGTSRPASRGTNRDDIAYYGHDYVHFCQKVKKLTSIDLESYKGQQMHRRLESYRSRNNMPNFVSLAKALESDPGKLQALVDYLTINVSEFFRNPDQWKILRERVLPGLLRESPVLRVWSAGSSSGQEAYTLAMILQEAGAKGSVVLGTDIDNPSLRKAQAGFYSAEECSGIPKHSLTKFFTAEGCGFRARDTLRKMVEFDRLNLLSDPYPVGMDLIMCRNVLIYFTDKGKTQVIMGLSRSLRRGGVLFTGATEAIFAPATYGLTQVQPFFYRT